MSNILVTGGAALKSSQKLTFQAGDIRNLEVYWKVTENIECFFHEAALGSVPRSIKDPITSNEVNVSSFLHMRVGICDVCMHKKSSNYNIHTL